MNTYVIVFAAGSGKRMDSSIPKQFLLINKKPILAYTLEKFNSLNQIKGIVLVVANDQINKAKLIVKKYNFSKVIKIVEGDKTALESQFKGLSWLKENIINKNDLVIIHDGVRPLINKDTIIRTLNIAKRKGNAVTISSANETISVNLDNAIKEIIPRENCSIVRAPQIFKFRQIYNAHIKLKESKLHFVDSASMMKSLGYKINIFEGPVENIKITTKYDYFVCKHLLGNNK